MTKSLKERKVISGEYFCRRKMAFLIFSLKFQNNIQVEEFYNMILEFKEVEDIRTERYDKLLLWIGFKKYKYWDDH